MTNNIISRTLKLAAVVLGAVVLQGCVTAQFNPTTPGTKLAIRGGSDKSELPRSESLASKTTGRYEFMAVSPQGEKMYGLLPLKVNPGTIVMSALFFAPAIFIFGIRDAFTFYELDPASNTMRYRMSDTDAWSTYVPTTEETERAKIYFEANARGCKISDNNGQQTIECQPGTPLTTAGK